MIVLLHDAKSMTMTWYCIGISYLLSCSKLIYWTLANVRRNCVIEVLNDKQYADARAVSSYSCLPFGTSMKQVWLKIVLRAFIHLFVFCCTNKICIKCKKLGMRTNLKQMSHAHTRNFILFSPGISWKKKGLNRFITDTQTLIY